MTTAAGVIPMRKAIKLLCLLLAVGGVGVIVGRSIAPPARPPTRQEAEADVGLDRVVAKVDFRATAFQDAIEFLRQRTGTNILVGWRALEAAGIDRNTPITLHVTNLPLRRVLELVCDEAGGSTVMLISRARDGTIVVMTADDAARYAELRLYDVDDLLRANHDFRVRLGWRPTTNPAAGGGGGMSLGSGGGGGQPDPYQEAIDDLTRIITEFVAPDMWRDNGGTIGTLRVFNGRLMITATPDMHEQIRELLEMIRRGK